MIAQTTISTGSPNFVSSYIVTKIKAALVEQFFLISITFDLFSDFEKLFEFRLILDQIKSAAHRDFEVTKTNLNDPDVIDMRFTACRKTKVYS
jgi:hypothetical protein